MDESYRRLPPISTFTKDIPSDSVHMMPTSVESVLVSKPDKQAKKVKSSVVRCKFSLEEDCQLINIVHLEGIRNWNEVAKMMKTRNPRQCRERWNNYLNPRLRGDPWSPQEDQLLLQKKMQFGTRWGKIAQFFPNRSDNSVRNRIQQLERHMEKNGSTA